jgi:hypothetical protein
LDEDMLLTSVSWVNGYYKDGYQKVDSYLDEWGVTWKKVEYKTSYGKGKYTEPFGHPLAEDRALETYLSPIPIVRRSTLKQAVSRWNSKMSTGLSALLRQPFLNLPALCADMSN